MVYIPDVVYIPRYAPWCIQYVHLRNMQVGKWLYGGSMQEFVHLLNLRQRSVEAARHTTSRVLYFGPDLTMYVHPPAGYNESRAPTHDDQVMTEKCTSRERLRQTGCDRCCPDQDKIILIFNIHQNHWICAMLEMTSCSIFCFDSLGVSF